MSVNLESVLKTIQEDKDKNLKPENIRYGTSCLGVKGTLKPVTLTGGDTAICIYLQDETPTDPNGIWINTDKSINDIYLENERYISTNDTIYSDQASESEDNLIYQHSVPSNFCRATYCQRGNILHIFGRDYSSANTSPAINQHYKYDFDTNTYTKLSDCPTPQGYSGCEWINDDTIYIFGSAHSDYKGYVYKYTISTDNWELVNNIETEVGLTRSTYYPIATCYDNNDTIYILFTTSSGAGILFKYYISSNKYERITTSGEGLPSSNSYTNMIYLGNYIYLSTVSSFTYGYTYPLLRVDLSTFIVSRPNQTYISTSDSRLQYYRRMINIGQNFYLIGASYSSNNSKNQNTSFFKLNISKSFADMTYSSIRSNNSFDTYVIDSAYPLGYFKTANNDVIVSLGGYKSPNTSVGILLKDKSYDFENDTIMIYTNKGSREASYLTELYKTDRVINGKIQQGFNDVNLYDKSQEKIIKNLTTYYGNGTDWIKIK